MKIIIAIIAVFAFTACGSDSSSSDSEDRVEALAAWETAGQAAQETLCTIFNDPGVTEEALFAQMTSGENSVSNGVAYAKIDILKEECS